MSDKHGGCGSNDHEHFDDNLNFPFHYHYELQKVMEGERASLSLPAFIFQIQETEMSTPKTVEERLQEAASLNMNCVYAHIRLDEDGSPVIINNGEVMDCEDALDYLIDHDMGAIFHINPNENEETETTASTLDIISRVWDEECMPLTIASHLPVCLTTANEVMPYSPKALFVETWVKENGLHELEGLIENLSPAALIMSDAALNEERIEPLLDTELPLAIITADDPLHGKRLLHWGADSLISPTVQILKENLE